MDDILSLVSSGFALGQQILDDDEKRFKAAEEKLKGFLTRAKETIGPKNNVFQKPAKRPMRKVISEEEEDSQQDSRLVSAQAPADELRPLRTARAKNVNYKELPANTKMRNDNNTVVVKTERTSVQRTSSSVKLQKMTEVQMIEIIESKENQEPEAGQAQRIVTDEGIASATESMGSSKRSNSVELIATKTVEVDITSGDEMDKSKMPPPPVPKKTGRPKGSKKQAPAPPAAEPVQEATAEMGRLRITRSKIKQEKLSQDAIQHPQEPSQPQEEAVQPPQVIDASVNETVSKKGKKKFPVPFLIKIEPNSNPGSRNNSGAQGDETFDVPPKTASVNETFDVAEKIVAANETVTLGPAASPPNPNATVTLDKNPHDSLMTEDNDESDEDEIPLAAIKGKKQAPAPPVPPKLKKNEVFNPYMQSPVKQKVQAFEKHAAATPERFRAHPMKYNTMKTGATPSKVALFNSKTTTPSGFQKGPQMPSSAPGTSKTLPRTMKKMNSMSQESLDEMKRAMNVNIQLEEKRKAREEKQRQAQLQREALEREKREQAQRAQQEREEKYRKIMREKEEKARMDNLKKKLLKEKQIKKLAEEKAKKDEAPTLPLPKSAEQPGKSKPDNLYLAVQKSIITNKKNEEAKNVYGFDMLQTDDETDDESRPSAKRPPPPDWSKKSKRKPQLKAQSFMNSDILDTLFSVKPISVDLKAIFPAIEPRKLIRNSSAVWRTPPKNYKPNSH